MTSPDTPEDRAAKAPAPAPAVRQPLKQRREHFSIRFEHNGHRYTAGWGTFDDRPAGPLAEVFLNTEKNGSVLDVAARDAAISASLLLQFGCPVETLRHALTRNGDGSASGPLGAFLDMMAGGDAVP